MPGGIRDTEGPSSRSRRCGTCSPRLGRKPAGGVARGAGDDDGVVVVHPGIGVGRRVDGGSCGHLRLLGIDGSADHRGARAEWIVCGEAHLVTPVRRRRAISMPAISKPEPAASSAPIGEPVKGRVAGRGAGRKTVGVNGVDGVDGIAIGGRAGGLDFGAPLRNLGGGRFLAAPSGWSGGGLQLTVAPIAWQTVATNWLPTALASPVVISAAATVEPSPPGRGPVGRREREVVAGVAERDADVQHGGDLSDDDGRVVGRRPRRRAPPPRAGSRSPRRRRGAGAGSSRAGSWRRVPGPARRDR